MVQATEDAAREDGVRFIAPLFPSIQPKHGHLEIGCENAPGVAFVLDVFGPEVDYMRMGLGRPIQSQRTLEVTNTVPSFLLTTAGEISWETVLATCGNRLAMQDTETWIKSKEVKLERPTGIFTRFAILMPRGQALKARLLALPEPELVLYPFAERKSWIFRYQLTERELGKPSHHFLKDKITLSHSQLSEILIKDKRSVWRRRTTSDKWRGREHVILRSSCVVISAFGKCRTSCPCRTKTSKDRRIFSSKPWLKRSLRFNSNKHIQTWRSKYPSWTETSVDSSCNSREQDAVSRILQPLGFWDSSTSTGSFLTIRTFQTGSWRNKLPASVRGKNIKFELIDNKKYFLASNEKARRKICLQAAGRKSIIGVFKSKKKEDYNHELFMYLVCTNSLKILFAFELKSLVMNKEKNHSNELKSAGLLQIELFGGPDRSFRSNCLINKEKRRNDTEFLCNEHTKFISFSFRIIYRETMTNYKRRSCESISMSIMGFGDGRQTARHGS